MRSAFRLIVALVGAASCGGATGGEEADAAPVDGSTSTDSGLRDGNSSDDAPGMGSFSCEATSFGYHFCTKMTWTGGDASTEASLKAGCTGTLKGMLVSSCTHMNSNGGCSFVKSFPGGLQVEYEEWYYDLSEEQCRAACSGVSGTFLIP